MSVIVERVELLFAGIEMMVRSIEKRFLRSCVYVCYMCSRFIRIFLIIIQLL